MLRRNPKNLATSFVTRWRIKPLPSLIEPSLPGLGFAKWNVELLKVRNGKTGSWQMVWKNRKFELIQEQTVVEQGEQRKIV
jgi:protein ImuA